MKLSPKARFVAQIFRTNSNINIFYVLRNDRKRFREEWDHDRVELATSISGVLFNYLLVLLKSPKDLRDGILRRLFKKKIAHTFVSGGFISELSKTLYEYFATTSRSDDVVPFLKRMRVQKIFLIDEFISIKTLDLQLLKQMGPIVYVSQDVASQHFDFETNFISRRLIYKLERKILEVADIVIACSGRDRLKYLEMGAKNVIFYPNIYPNMKFEPCTKDDNPSISIVFQNRWGAKNALNFNEVFKALSRLDRRIKVYVIGMKPQQLPANIKMEHYEYIHSKLDYMRILSKSWIGINIGIHKAGSNERKYDYAMAGLVVFSDTLGCRGDLLPYEYTYFDNNDLTAKLGQLLEFSREKIIEMGTENRSQALSLAEKQRDLVSRSITKLVP